jgi:uncharacterized membrane protein YgcG
MLALSLGTAFAQNCSSVVNDESGTFTPSDSATIERAANHLLDHGILPHVIIVASASSYGGNFASIEAKYEKQCPSWRAPNGSRAANLLSFVVVLNPHWKNVYVGGALTPAMGTPDADDNRFSQAANPYFRQGNYAGGISKAMEDFGAADVAFHDQRSHPVQSSTTVNNYAKPTDLAPVTSMFKTIFIVLVLLLIIGSVIYFYRKMIKERKEDRQEADAAQQAAQGAVMTATTLFRIADQTNPKYAEIAAEYSDLSGQISYDPNTDGLSPERYQVIAKAWNDLVERIRSLTGPRFGSAYTTADTAPAPRNGSSENGGSVHQQRSHRRDQRSEPVPSTPQPTVIHDTTVIDRGSGGGDLLTGLFIGEALSNNRDDRDDRSERPSYRDSEPSSNESEPESEPESSGSGSSWGGDSPSSDSSTDTDSSSGDGSGW